MVSPKSEPMRIWPALLAYQAFDQTFGIWIVGLLAVVLMTAKFHDALLKKTKVKKGSVDFSDDGVLSAEASQAAKCTIVLDKPDSSNRSTKSIDTKRSKYFEFFCILRTKGFYLKRIKQTKTSVKCVRLNSNNELSWSKKYHFRLGSSSSELRLDGLVSTFLCESENHDLKASQFIIQFPSKVLCFAAATRDASVYIVECLEGLRICLEADPYIFIHLNEYYRRRFSSTNFPTPILGMFLEDDVSVQTSTTSSSFDQDATVCEKWHRSLPFSLHRRREAIIVQPI